MEAPEKQQIERMKEDALIQLRFNREFYHRLVLLLRYLYNGKTEAEIVNAIKQIEEKKITEEWAMHYETMMYLVKGSEEYAQQNNMTEFVDPEIMRQETEKDSQ